MKAGKLSESVLKRSVFKQLHNVNAKDDTALGVGMDFGKLSFEKDSDFVCAVSTMPFLYEGSVDMTIHHALNNILCGGAIPKGILVTVLLPTSASEQELRNLETEIAKVCEEEQILVLGGHTEVVRSVSQITLSVTAVGCVNSDLRLTCKAIRPGMDILVSKWVGLEGTSILAKQKEEALCTRYARPFIENAKKFDQYRSIRSEAAVAAMSGVVAMHDISEGGVYGALWEMAQCAGVGLDIDLKEIPIRQETVEICEFLDINPYKLISGGSVLMVAEDGNSVVRAMEKANISVAIIGKVTDSNDRVLICEEERRFLETTQTDELWKIFGRKTETCEKQEKEMEEE